MRAVFQREYRSLSHSITGMLALALLLFGGGLSCSLFNVLVGNTQFADALLYVQFILIPAVPLLTCRMATEDRRAGTDRLLASLPLSPLSVVLGKFFAAWAQLGLGCLILGVYPILLSLFGMTGLGAAYATLLGLFLLGGALIAFCLFLSSLVRRLYVALAVAFGGTVVLFVLDLLGSLIGVWGKIISPFTQFTAFSGELFSLEAVIYELGFAALFLSLTVLVHYIRAARGGGESAQQAKIRSGAVAAIVLAAVILCNAVVAFLPGHLVYGDLTASSQYSLSDKGRHYLATVDKPVTIYALAPNRYLSPALTALLAPYEAASPNITVTVIDPAKDTDIIAQYEGAESLPYYSFIVASEARYRIISSETIEYYVVAMEEGSTAVTVEDYSYLYTMYGDQIASVSTHYFAAEEALVEGVDYVIADSIPHMYLVTGQDEMTLDEDTKTMLEELGLTCEKLNLGKVKSIPEDAAQLLWYAPAQDITEAQADMLIDYLDRGGHITLITDVDNVTMPNLMRICEAMGFAPGTTEVILEGNANRYVDSFERLLPVISTETTITSTGVEYGYTALFPSAHGIDVAETVSSDIQMAALFYTSDAAYIKKADGSEEDIGVMTVGAISANAATGAQFAWYTSSEAFTEAVVKESPGNQLYLAMTLDWQAKSYTSTVDISPVQITDGVMETSAFAILLLSAILVLLVPALAVVMVMGSRGRRMRKN